MKKDYSIARDLISIEERAALYQKNYGYKQADGVLENGSCVLALNLVVLELELLVLMEHVEHLI